MYVCARFHEIPAKGLQDIKETKCYGRTDGRTDGQRENSIPPLKLRFSGGYKYSFWFKLMMSFKDFLIKILYLVS